MSVDIINAMTVDVEDYFQVSAFEKSISKDDWPHLECRVERNMDTILQLFADGGVKATFFMLGWIAERYPKMIKRVVSEGHELASHGYEHIRVTQQTKDEFYNDITRTKSLLEDISGEVVNGYRAASYSIGETNLWALDALKRAGYLYSSSIYPIKHDLYGMPDAPRFAFKLHEDAILEFPVTTIEFNRHKFPCGGGGYFRLFPYAFSKWMMKRVNTYDKESCIFYFHPWEIDTAQPRQKDISMKTRFRHYLNIGRMEGRITSLIKDFSWDRMDVVFADKIKNHTKAI